MGRGGIAEPEEIWYVRTEELEVSLRIPFYEPRNLGARFIFIVCGQVQV